MKNEIMEKRENKYVEQELSRLMEFTLNLENELCSVLEGRSN